MAIGFLVAVPLTPTTHAGNPGKECAEVETESIVCREDGSFTWSFILTNLSGQVAHGVILGNPAIAPNSIPLVPPLASGSSTPLQVTITGAAPGSTLCTPLILANVAGNVCCKRQVCIDLPECDCAQLLDVTFTPTGTAGQYALSFTFINLASWSTGHLVLFGTGLTVSPSIVNVGPVAPFASTGIGPLVVSTGAAPGTQICITIGNHSPDWLECCFVELCVTVPEPPCIGDLNGDGVVNGADLAILAAGWGGAGLGDLNGNGIVDGSDLAILLAAWGPC